MKKIFFLVIFIVAAIVFDGALAKDIFDYRIHTPSGWLGLVLITGIFLTLFWADTTKIHRDKNNRE